MLSCVAAAAPLALAPPLVVSHAPLARTRITPIVPLRAAPPPRMQLDDDAIAQKMAAMRKSKKRRPVSASPSATPAAPPPPLILPGAESSDIPVFPVPPNLRLPNAPACAAHGRHVALDELFPGAGLGEAWDTNAALWTALRRALRADLFEPPQTWSEVQVRAATELSSACMVSWGAVAADEARACAAFGEALAAHGIGLAGREFLLGLASLCGEHDFCAVDPARAHERPRTSSGALGHGSLIDIVPLARQVQHSWHQDVGVPGLTVLLGFPPRDRYVGGGVFSSHVKLSHPLRPTHGEAHGAVVEYERFEPPPPQIADEYVLRPLYGRGREIWVSDDSCHLHSTPDRQCREGLWRFM